MKVLSVTILSVASAFAIVSLNASRVEALEISQEYKSSSISAETISELTEILTFDAFDRGGDSPQGERRSAGSR